MSSRGLILLTGASGFIAKHIASQLLEAGYHVRASVRSLSRSQEVIDAVRPTLGDSSNLDSRLSFVALDLANDQGWDDAATGVDAVMHTASPFPTVQPSDEQEIIRPAVDGVLRALNAAHRAGVRRVVMTSSTAAITNTALQPGRRALDERDWSQLSGPRATPYVKSKTLAERAAWDFVEKEAPEIGLTAINPGFAVGPPLDAHYGTSLKAIERLLRGADPMLPNFGYASVDVRDVATAHVLALGNAQAIGNRLICGDQFLWYIEMARILKAAYPDRSIATRKAPAILVRLLALFDKSIGTILPNLDHEERITCDRARSMLGINFRDVRTSLKETAEYLIGNGLV